MERHLSGTFQTKQITLLNSEIWKTFRSPSVVGFFHFTAGPQRQG